MPTIGPREALDLALPASIDAGRVLSFQLRQKKTPQALIEEAATAIGFVNQLVMERYGGLLYTTQAPFAYYSQGGGARSVSPTKVEFKQTDAIRSDASGGMLPFRDIEDALSWTALYLRDALEAQTTADINLIQSRWRGRVDLDVLTRALTNTENAIGSGYDVPWAIGTGVNVPFLPPEYGAYVFDTTHTHFKAVNGAINATNADALLELMVKDLRHHGHTGRLTCLVSETDIAAYNSITKKFVKLLPTGVQAVAGNTSGVAYVSQTELEGIPGEVFGLFMSDIGPTVIMRTHERIPTGYAWMTKSYGNNNPKNGIALREHPDRGFGMYPDPQLTMSINPELDRVLFKAGHGIGVNNRTNGVAGFIGSSTWANPVIS